MSQDDETRLSQNSLAPPAEISGPSTPTKRSHLSTSPEMNLRASSHSSHSDKSKILSPPSLSPSDMTPPPSAQVPDAPSQQSRSRSISYLTSPPDIKKTLCDAYGASENLPTTGEIDAADELKLRMIARELLSVAQEARMSALHFKLQNSLLSFTSNEAIKRAEVEHQLARREVEILQSSEYRGRHSESKPHQPIANVELELALKRNQELERTNTTLDRRLRRAKKLIEQEREKVDQLGEENRLLKKRIKDNREHFSLMIENGSLSPSPQMEIQTPHRISFPQFADSGHHLMNRGENNHPFAALLAADKVLNRESPSITSTPNRTRAQKQHTSGHMRGSHSLSSLPMTPARSRNTRQEDQYYTPGKETSDGHRDRDSTISASDIEEAETEEDIPASQTGAIAKSMFRSSASGNNLQDTRSVANAPKSSALLQTKLFGQVKKAGVNRPSNDLKRKASLDGAASKKTKIEDKVGLGIGT
ncbi:hypothetical protein EYZ11_004750 [Aspergillus tanneri]|uniref:Uncharacterized protein n=1 Tax=Aspergillus tanneri TaxID=1220188 RepID=A0A4S3JJW1_9EURO|nr:uncharacterized protein ATNIH1004_002741 [Aspergillus tanneri]KAA8650060.1 hypothetical protein ATNIH1004_002741 [Aspergillus tanneri]THC95753.1 hypothetical protein EYZ11_004750 [Aspergillus tanneri]